MKHLLLSVLVLSASVAGAQSRVSAPQRPRVIVGLMVDQMRWDFLHRYSSRYGEGGFKRLLREGYSCNNAMIPYAQTVTACGHASVYTGSVPAINGIMGNEWYSRELGRQVYCTEDPRVRTIGGNVESPPMSPRNLQVTTLCDELRIATNFRSKVIGIAIKDRGGILPAGHSANAAYWYDSGTGNWVSSSYYMPELPGWVNRFNDRKIPDSLYGLNWNTLYPIHTYTLSDGDDKSYEGKFAFDPKPVFPHNISAVKGKNYSILAATPHGNTLTLEFAKAAIQAEGLGDDEFTDVLALSLSSPDYIGHQFGPNSVEIEDTYLRLDRELEAFFRFLDTRFGKNGYLFFITADHGVAQVPEYSVANRLPGGRNAGGTTKALSDVAAKFHVRSLVKNFSNYQIYLDDAVIDSAKLDRDEVKAAIIRELMKNPGVALAFDMDEIDEVPLPGPIRERFILGRHPKLSGDIQVVLASGYLNYGTTGSSHGSWYPYDAHIPLVFMGWGIRPGKLGREVYMSDIAPTITTLLNIQMPSGTVGRAIPEITDAVR
jgi:predicted AlkP superfamily pyrophosphatase or phosphodiesterase